jgi:hypothetical protein
MSQARFALGPNPLDHPPDLPIRQPHQRARLPLRQLLLQHLANHMDPP